MAAGGRVALRANAVVAGTFVFIFGSRPDGVPIVRILVLGTVSSARDWSVLAIFAGVCLAFATVALPRVTLGLGGWMRSLPASSAEHRWAAIVALSASQFFCITFALFAVATTVGVYHAPLSPAKLIALPLIVTSVSALVLLTAGTKRRRVEPSRVSEWQFLRDTRYAFVYWVRFSWAAIPRAAVFSAVMLPAVFIAFAYVVLLHNPDLPPSTAHRTVRITGSLAGGALAASLSNALLRSRPTWAWSRSLPWSSVQRVVADVVAIGAPLFIALATLLPLDAWDALAVLATVPAIAVASAGSLRAGASRQTGAAGEVAIVATICGALIAVAPLLAVIPLAVTPILLRMYAARDRRIISSRFEELQHDALGDAAWLGSQ
jgi:hypothetical protein